MVNQETCRAAAACRLTTGAELAPLLARSRSNDHSCILARAEHKQTLTV
jgi:hypothetical protein